jgi:hypothetical protein
MKKFLPIIGLLIFFATRSTSQINPVDFSKFKYPDLVRRELVFSLDFSNDFTLDQSYVTSVISQNNKDFYLNNNVNANYIFTKNTRKYQGYRDFKIHSSTELFNQTFDSLTNRQKYVNSYASLYGFNRMYWNEKWFYEFNYNIYLSNSYFKISGGYNGLDNTILKDIDNAISITPAFALGYGRIEPVTDVVHVIVYLKNLLKGNRLQNIPDEEGMFQFAKLLSETKNERFFDARKKKMYEIQKIDSFLTVNNYSSVKDVNYFSILDDIWKYAGNFPRTCGYTLSVNLSPGYSMHNSVNFESDSTYSITNHDLLLHPHITFSHSKPVNALVQRNIYAGLGYRYRTEVFTNDHTNTVSYPASILAEAGISFGYYPTTRSYFETAFSLNTYGINNEEIPLYANLGLKTYYYISERLRFFMESGVNYHYRKDLNVSNIAHSVNYSIDAGIQYALF